MYGEGGSWEDKLPSLPTIIASSIETDSSENYARRWGMLLAPDPPAYNKAKDETQPSDAGVCPPPPAYEDALKTSSPSGQSNYRAWMAFLTTTTILFLLVMSTNHWGSHWSTVERPALLKSSPPGPSPQLAVSPGEVPPLPNSPEEHAGSPQPAVKAGSNDGGGDGGDRVIRYGGVGGGGGGGGNGGGGDRRWERDRIRGKDRDIGHGNRNRERTICGRMDQRKLYQGTPKAPRSKKTPSSLRKGKGPSAHPPLSIPSGGTIDRLSCLRKVPNWETLKELPGIDPHKETYTLCQQAHGYRLPNAVSLKDLKILASSPSIHAGSLATKFYSSSLEAMDQLLHLRSQGLPLISATWTLRLLQYTYRRGEERPQRRRFGAQLQIVWHFNEAWRFEDPGDQRLLERCAHLEASTMLGWPLEEIAALVSDDHNNTIVPFDLQGGSKWEGTLLENFLTHQCYRFSGDMTRNRQALFAPPGLAHTRRIYWRGGTGKGKGTKIQVHAALPPQNWFTSLSVEQAVPLPRSRPRPQGTLSEACTGRGLVRGKIDSLCICSHGFGGPQCEDRLRDVLLPSTRGRRPRDIHNIPLADLTPYDLLSNSPPFTGAHHVYYEDEHGEGPNIQAVLPLPLPPPLYFLGRPLSWRLAQRLQHLSHSTKITSPIRVVHQDAQGRLRSLTLVNGKIIPNLKIGKRHAMAACSSNRYRMQYRRKLLPGQLVLAPHPHQLFLLQA